MTEVAVQVRGKRDVRWYSDHILQILDGVYAKLKVGAQTEDFIRDILEVVGSPLDDSSIEEPLEIIMQFVSEDDRKKGPDWVAKSPYGSVLVSAAYSWRAIGAEIKGNHDLAWSYIADAQYWVGIAVSSKSIDELREQTIIRTRRATVTDKAKSGAEGRDKKYEPLREYAYQQAREQIPASGWRSRSHAVKVISEAVLEFSRRYAGPELKTDGVGKTLDGWLKNMPNSEAFFPVKKKKN